MKQTMTGVDAYRPIGSLENSPPNRKDHFDQKMLRKMLLLKLQKAV